ncbi:MAG TPA: OprD family outer membrane porin [Methyloceanibacter sp.]|nr:OprD family outer membrane porin [Methyloceanibacter sp.]
MAELGRTSPFLVVPCIMVWLISGAPAFAQGAGGGGGSGGLGNAFDYPIPASVHEAYSPINEGFASPSDPRADLKGPTPYVDEREVAPKAARQGDVPFFRDTDLKFNSRSYWMDEDIFGLGEPKALTSGGWLSYRSGYLGDILQLRGALYTSQPLYAPEDAGGTLNLTLDGDQITTLGQANARAKFLGQELIAGRQLVRTPYINPNDDRMIPDTFEGVVLLPEQSADQKLGYIASYLWRYKPRNTPNFIPFTQALGVEQDEGVLINGVNYRVGEFHTGVVNYWIKDAMNTAYGEVDYTLPLGGGKDGPGIRLGLNNIDQRSVGAGLIRDSPFATNQVSARLLASYRGFVLTSAISRVSRDHEILKPYGWSPAYTAMMISSFQRAGETAYLTGLSYDFSRIGLNGLTFFAGWGWGFDAINSKTGAPLANRDELDLRLEYEPHDGALEGLRVQLDYIDMRLIDAPLPSDDLTQFRVIVNYMVPLL